VADHPKNYKSILFEMKKILAFIVLAFIVFSCKNPSQPVHSTVGDNVKFGDNPQAGHYADVNGIKLYYETYGSGEALVMLHGNGGSINAFKKQIPFFAKYYQVIAIDSRLQGKSGGSPDKISYDLMASDFCALLDQLNIKSAYVLGWSDGGIDGILMAMNCPDRIKKLAASGANTVPDTTALSKADIEGMKNTVASSRSSATEKALNQMMIDQPNIAYSELGKIKCPVLIMAGDHDMIKPEHTLKIFQSIPGASLCIFPDSHHGVCIQHPEMFNETVLRFFRK
jgi:Predicted hydrolases or acyltransferases (alpha/beta hydrolase superfamily)